MEDFGVSFPLLADSESEVTNRYGLVYHFPDRLRQAYLEALGVDLADYNGGDPWALPMPARYLVDGDRTVRWASVSADYSRRPDPADTLEALERLRLS